MKEDKLCIIIQAGGRGSRMRHNTWNKPKCLISIDGKPILYHLFDIFTYAKFIIISDYKHDILSNYLELFPPDVDCKIVETKRKGTSSELNTINRDLDHEYSILLLWSDLLLSKPPDFLNKRNLTIGISSEFKCRWVVKKDGTLVEQPSINNGVIGLFFLPKNKRDIDLPNEGEFVKWLSQKNIQVDYQQVQYIQEIGDVESLKERRGRSNFCRFFNKVDIDSETVTKQVVDSQYEHILSQEINWYIDMQRFNFDRIPKIISYKPFRMQRIKGLHPFEVSDLNKHNKMKIILNYFETLDKLHSLETTSSSKFKEECLNVYFEKTISRINSVKGLIPFSDKDSFTINGKRCKNWFARNAVDQLKDIIKLHLLTDKYYCIHGDPTFSNSIIDHNWNVYFIDPRGYFHTKGIFGDKLYDYSKLFYSAVGGYDIFNRKEFALYLDDYSAELLINESCFKIEAYNLFTEKFGEDIIKIRIIHSMLWASLSGYVKDDIDSIIGAYAHSLYLLENTLS